MLLESVHVHNLGVFTGEQSLDLRPKDDRRVVTLIGGLNGCGKTTLLEAILLALYGKLSPAVRDSGVAYPEYLRRLVNRTVTEDAGAGVEVQFSTHQDGREATFRVCRSWSCRESRTRERLDVLVNGQRDAFASEHWPEVMESFIPAQLSQLFFFDGERIEHLADPRKSPELIASALHALLGVDIVKQLEADLVILSRRKRRDLQSDTERPELDRHERELEDLHGRRTELKQKIASTADPLRRAESVADSLELEFRKQGGELAASREELIATEVAVGESLAETAGRLRALAAGALPLMIAAESVHRVQREVAREEELEEQRHTESILVQRDREILDTLGTEGLDNSSVDLVDRVLSADRAHRAPDPSQCVRLGLSAGCAAAMTADIEYAVANSTEAAALLQEHATALAARDSAEQALAACPDDDVLAPLTARLNEAVTNARDLRLRREQLQGELAEADRRYAAAETSFDRLLKKQGEQAVEQDDVRRVVSHIERATPVLEEFRRKLVEQHLERICAHIYEGFARLLRKQRLVSGVQIDAKSYELSVIHPSGAKVPAERLSAGERQLLATSILWGLAKAAGRPLPVMVDTPLGRLDSEHRTHFVERYLPYASHQVIVLSTDEEIDAEVFESMRPWLAHSYVLRHDDETASTSIQRGYFWEETADVH